MEKNHRMLVIAAYSSKYAVTLYSDHAIFVPPHQLTNPIILKCVEVEVSLPIAPLLLV